MSEHALLERVAPLEATTLRLWKLAAESVLADPTTKHGPRLQAEVIIRLLDEIDRLNVARSHDSELDAAIERVEAKHARRIAGAELTDSPEQRGCDHKFIDSKSCVKCAWVPPPR